MTLPRFWQHYRQLPKEIKDLADKNFDLLKADPHHPSLRLKKVGKRKQLWSVRVGGQYRALGVDNLKEFFGSGSVRIRPTISSHLRPQNHGQ